MKNDLLIKPSEIEKYDRHAMEIEKERKADTKGIPKLVAFMVTQA